jgi:hypothetical protein
MEDRAFARSPLALSSQWQPPLLAQPQGRGQGSTDSTVPVTGLALVFSVMWVLGEGVEDDSEPGRGRGCPGHAISTYETP